MSAGLIVAGARQAGDLVAAQSGLSTASLFDPETGDDLTALGHLYGLIALVVFLAMDGPLVMVGALVESYRTVPAGGLVIGGPLVARTFAAGGRLPWRCAGGRSASGRGGAGGNRHRLDWQAGAGRAGHVALTSRAIDPGNRPDLAQPGPTCRNSVAGLVHLFLGILDPA